MNAEHSSPTENSSAGPEFSATPETETAPRGDHQPMVEELPDGAKRFTTRVVRPEVGSIKPKAQVRAEVEAHEDVKDSLGIGQSYPDAKRENYDYHLLMPEIGTPESIPVEPTGPTLLIASVRHLAHVNNVVGTETQAAFRTRAENLVDDLQLTEHSLVFVIASPAANFEAGPTGADEAPTVHSRTDSTVDVVRAVLDERGIQHTDNTIGVEGPVDDPLTGDYRHSLDEFQVSDSARNRQAGAMATANREAAEAGEELPHPEAPSKPPTVYASDAPSAADLESKTGMTEVASATVARGLTGHDLLERHFLAEGGVPDGVDRIVVIEGRHGQYCTNISEALLVATDGAHPIAFAENGAYSLLEARRTTEGEIVEDYIIETSPRTGMVEK
jgi:hypothetical protein